MSQAMIVFIYIYFFILFDISCRKMLSIPKKNNPHPFVIEYLIGVG